MSMSAEKEMPSSGTLPQATKKNKRSSRKKHIDMDSKSARVLNSHLKDPGLEGSSTDEHKCKKRNKSVSFDLDGEGFSKKSKDEDFVPKIHETRVFRNSRMKKYKKDRVIKDQVGEEMEASTSNGSGAKKPKAKVLAKAKVKDDQIQTSKEVNGEGNNDSIPDTDKTNPPKKLKKRKRSKKCSKTDCDDEPTIKIRKDSSSDDELTCELENLHIGPDPHNLANLLDDMVPAGPKLKKKKVRKVSQVTTDVNENVSHEFDLKKVVKWTKKRWNKDKKVATTMDKVNSSVVVDNLPMAISTVYEMKLMEVFEKFGSIKRIGLPEINPDSDESVFSATIFFDSEEAATKALAHDNGLVCGSVVRVRSPPHPASTTAVARCYTQPTVEDLRAIFAEAGPLGSIRVEKRRGGGMAVAFLEFDGPASVERAIALSGTARVNGKPVYVNKFEIRPRNKQT